MTQIVNSKYISIMMVLLLFTTPMVFANPIDDFFSYTNSLLQSGLDLIGLGGDKPVDGEIIIPIDGGKDKPIIKEEPIELPIDDVAIFDSVGINDFTKSPIECLGEYCSFYIDIDKELRSYTLPRYRQVGEDFVDGVHEVKELYPNVWVIEFDEKELFSMQDEYLKKDLSEYAKEINPVKGTPPKETPKYIGDITTVIISDKVIK